MVWPFLYFAGERLSAAELTAARLDGDLIEVGEAFMPADAVETRELRAGSLRRLVGAGLAVTHESAAWVHGAIAEPPVVHRVQRRESRRGTRVADARVRYRDVRLPDDHAEIIAGLAVSIPERTLVDLLRDGHGRNDPASAAEAMLAWRPSLLTTARDWLEVAGPMHHKRPTLVLLRERAQDEVTR